ncbi:MAG: OsmC family peroxiredoxin [Alphaproteobacteria bacterium]|nr:MAG: OsmC family peroxiredoxin [Alphaproteobacteria bacterium]
MSKLHQYNIRTTWTGAGETGTTNYKAYSRDYTLAMDGRPAILGSSDPNFRGDATRHNPEEMLVAATSSCHMLWYLHFCAVNGVVVKSYIDEAEGIMDEGNKEAPGHFTKIVLRPRITITAESDVAKAEALHENAHHACFIANTLNCPVECEPTIEWD